MTGPRMHRLHIQKDTQYMTEFKDLGLAQAILRAVEAEGYTTPTPIQGKAIPPMLEGRDLLGIAQTGTGKTAAFSLPLLHALGTDRRKSVPNTPRALILAPTRELAGQIGDSIRTYGHHFHMRTAVVFGGTSIRQQIHKLNRGVHILVATPGRLVDLMNQGHVHLDQIEVFVLDEADRMLDMGFIHDVRKIAAELPNQRQTALFSATMPKTVKGLAGSLLTDPIRVEVAPAATTAEKVEQRVLFVPKAKKRALLSEIMADDDIERVLIFTRTKHGADRVARHLHQAGVRSDAIHGNKAQNARQRALDGFRSGRIRALVATDIAARGIDVDGVTHVINFELPNEPDSYVHRIGRTARAGAAGMALSFCDMDERAYLRDIEKTIRQSVPVIDDHPFHAEDIANAHDARPPKRNGNRRPQKGNRPNGQSRGTRPGNANKPNRQRRGNNGGGRPRRRGNKAA